MTSKTYPAWHARSSSLGGYNACTMRAWLDHALQTGRVDCTDWGFKQGEKTNVSSPPADFGTCAHWVTQTALRCCFKDDDDWNNMAYTGWDAAPAIVAKYSQEQWDNGASMFPSDQAAKDMTEIIAKGVADCMPKGDKWIAESCFSIDGLLKGHIDFLRHDHKVIVDLKTTGSKPPGGKPKMAHLWQLMGYALGVMKATGTLPEKGYIIYAHSRGDWCFRTKPVDFHSPMVRTMILKMMDRLAMYADYDALTRAAIPNPGEACNDFCPYTRCCRDVIVPRGSTVRDRQADAVIPAAPSAMNIFGGTP